MSEPVHGHCPPCGVQVRLMYLARQVVQKPFPDRSRSELAPRGFSLGYDHDAERGLRGPQSRRDVVGEIREASSVENEDVCAVALDELLGTTRPLRGLNEEPPARKQEAGERQEACVGRRDDDADRGSSLSVFHLVTRAAIESNEPIATDGTSPSDQRPGRLDLSTRTRPPILVPEPAGWRP